MLAKETQAHTGAAAATDPNVQYVYATTSGTYNGISDVLTKSNRLTAVAYPNGRKAFRDYTPAAADPLSRLAAIKDDDGSGDEGPTLAVYSFNGLNRLVMEDFTEPDVRLDYFRQPDGTATAGTYKGLDRFGRVATQAWRAYTAEALREQIAYGYDYNSNRTYRHNVQAENASRKLDEMYAYDDLDRLVDFKRGKLNGGKTDIPTTDNDRARREEWPTLTDTGNWTDYEVDENGDGDYSDAADLDQDRTHNAANECAAISEADGQTAWADPACDARGNMTTVPSPAGPDQTYACTYDAWNRLVKVTDGQNTIAEYRYDALNRRIRKFTPDQSNWTVTEYYYNASWQLLESRRAAGVSRTGQPPSEPPAASAVHEQYVWSERYLDAPILRDRDLNPGTGDLGRTGSGLDERLYYLTDAHMSVTAVIDTSGAVVERYAYDPYGRATILDGATGGQTDWAVDADQSSDVANEVLWCGYLRDAETGLYHVRRRMYHPLLGRWLQRDPIGYVDGMSLYEYVRGDAINLIDPDGLVDWGRLWNRITGGLQMVGGAVETVGGAFIGTVGAVSEVGSLGATTPVSVPVAVAGAVVTVNGIDNLVTGAQQLWTGEPQDTAVYEMVKDLGGSDTTATIVDATLAAAGGAAATAKIAQVVGRAAQGAGIAAKTEKVCPVDANKLNHIFGKGAHGLDALVNQFGSREAAYQAIEQATEAAVKSQGLAGLFRTTIQVGGQTITVKGNVVDGVVKIGTAFK